MIAKGLKRRHAGDIHNRTSDTSSNHAGCHNLSNDHWRTKIHCNGLIKCAYRRPEKWLQNCDAGVVHEKIDLSCVLCGFTGGASILKISEDRFTADFFFQLFQITLGSADRHYARIEAVEHDRNGAANSFPCTGDQGSSLLEINLLC
jgi:hypothetical protein